MSPQKYVRLFDDLARLAKRKHSGKAMRIPYHKPFGNDWDYILFAQRPGNDPRPDRVAIDDAMRRVHLRELGDGWLELTAANARKHLARTMTQSMIFPTTSKGWPVEERAAEQIARQAVELLPSARFYTNGTFASPTASWFLDDYHALMDKLVDTGLVVVNDKHLFMIWREEID